MHKIRLKHDVKRKIQDKQVRKPGKNNHNAIVTEDTLFAPFVQRFSNEKQGMKQ